MQVKSFTHAQILVLSVRSTFIIPRTETILVEVQIVIVNCAVAKGSVKIGSHVESRSSVSLQIILGLVAST